MTLYTVSFVIMLVYTTPLLINPSRNLSNLCNEFEITMACSWRSPPTTATGCWISWSPKSAPCRASYAPPPNHSTISNWIHPWSAPWRSNLDMCFINVILYPYPPRSWTTRRQHHPSSRIGRGRFSPHYPSSRCPPSVWFGAPSKWIGSSSSYQWSEYRILW